MVPKEHMQDFFPEEYGSVVKFNSDPDPTAEGEYSLMWPLIDKARRLDTSFNLLRYGKAPDLEIKRTINAQVAEWNEYCRLSRAEDDERQRHIRTARQHAITPSPSPLFSAAVNEDMSASPDALLEGATESTIEDKMEETEEEKTIIATAESMLQKTRPEPPQTTYPESTSQILVATQRNHPRRSGFEKRQEVRSPETALNVEEQWSEGEIEQLKGLWEKHKDTKRIQGVLQGRERISIWLKINALFPPHLTPRMWESQEDRRLVELYEAGKEPEEMEQCLDYRRVPGIKKRLANLFKWGVIDDLHQQRSLRKPYAPKPDRVLPCITQKGEPHVSKPAPFYQLSEKCQQTKVNERIAGNKTSGCDVHRIKTGRIGKIKSAKRPRSQAGNERSTIARRRMK